MEIKASEVFGWSGLQSRCGSPCRLPAIAIRFYALPDVFGALPGVPVALPTNASMAARIGLGKPGQAFTIWRKSASAKMGSVGPSEGGLYLRHHRNLDGNQMACCGRMSLSACEMESSKASSAGFGYRGFEPCSITLARVAAVTGCDLFPFLEHNTGQAPVSGVYHGGSAALNNRLPRKPGRLHAKRQRKKEESPCRGRNRRRNRSPGLRRQQSATDRRARCSPLPRQLSHLAAPRAGRSADDRRAKVC